VRSRVGVTNRLAARPNPVTAWTAVSCQESILLVFNPEHTARDQMIINGGTISLHGTHGAKHVAFRVPEAELEAWRSRLHVAGVAIESEVTWPSHAHSIYFRDPAGNSLELATPNMWESEKARHSQAT
jgi:catechol 2,3-dioxygenase-like lactoylglutathione lyase family enzyme